MDPISQTFPRIPPTACYNYQASQDIDYPDSLGGLSRRSSEDQVVIGNRLQLPQSDTEDIHLNFGPDTPDLLLQIPSYAQFDHGSYGLLSQAAEIFRLHKDFQNLTSPTLYNQLLTMPQIQSALPTPQSPKYHQRTFSFKDKSFDADYINTQLGILQRSGNSMGNCSTIESWEIPQKLKLRLKFGQSGRENGSLFFPHGFCIGLNEEIVVADTFNSRISMFDQWGNFLMSFGNQGREVGCLFKPRKVLVLDNGDIVVCDFGLGPSRMQIFDSKGIFIRIIPIPFVNIVAGMTKTTSGDLVIVDSVRPTLFIINPISGVISFHDVNMYLREPSDIAFFDDKLYVCDFKGHSIVIFDTNGKYLQSFSTGICSLFPNGIDISNQGDIVVVDSHGNQLHIAAFDKKGCLLGHFSSTDVRISRCCGLAILSNGGIVTVAKDNHHVLVADAIQVPSMDPD